MKITVFFLTLFQTSLISAQITPQAELLELSNYGYRSGSTGLKTASAKALDLFEEILISEGSESQRLQIPGNKYNYDAAEILPTYASKEIGTSVTLWKSLLNDIPFLYAPEVVLPKSTSAFMDPKGAFIGVDHEFILAPKKIPSSVIHETYHAFTFKQVQTLSEDLYAGYYSVSSGSFLSPDNQEYYFRFGSIDEIVATALSAKIDTFKLLTESDLSKDEKENLLSEIYFSLNIVERLSRQMINVVNRLKARNDYSVSQHTLTLGKVSKEISQITFNLESYERDVKPGGGGTYMKPIVNGAKVIFYAIPTSNKKDYLKTRLEKLQAASEETVNLVRDAKKCVFVVIEYPRLEKSDLECLRAKAPKIFERLEARKAKTYPIEKFIKKSL